MYMLTLSFPKYLCVREEMIFKALFYIFLLASQESDKKQTVATLLLHSADPGKGSIMFIHWSRKFAKSDSYLRIIGGTRTTEAPGLHSSPFFKSLGQDRYLDDIIHTCSLTRGPLGPKGRERWRGAGRESFTAKKETERRVCGLRLFLP